MPRPCEAVETALQRRRAPPQASRISSRPKSLATETWLLPKVNNSAFRNPDHFSAKCQQAVHSVYRSDTIATARHHGSRLRRGGRRRAARVRFKLRQTLVRALRILRARIPQGSTVIAPIREAEQQRAEDRHRR